MTVLATVIPLIFGARIIHVYLTTREVLRSELRTAVAADADRAAIALELPIWNIDRSQVDRVVEITLRAPAIYAVVVEAAGRTHAMVRDASWKPVVFDGQVAPAGLLREDRDVVFGRDRIGAVTVYATPRFTEERLRKTVVGTGVLAAVVAVVLWATIWLLLRRLVVVPLRELEHYARDVSSGTRPDPASLGARFQGEIETLSNTLRHMVALLDVRYAQLETAEAHIRALAARLQAAREEEKTRIARDLHDDLGQLLTAVQMELRWVEERLAAHPESDLGNVITDRVVEAGRLVEQTTRSVQRIAADLRPSALDQLGLGAALRQEGRRFQERTGIPCEVVVRCGVHELEGRAAITLYRVAQEALTNVARHAGASRVTVTLAANELDVSLRVEDDGRGLDGMDQGPGALGLLGMKERATMIGGDVRFAGEDGRGTVVELRVPLSRAISPESRRALQ